MHRNLQMLGRLFRNFEFTPANDLGRSFSEFPGIFLLTIWQKSTNFGSIFFKTLRSLRPKILFFPSLALEMHRNLPIWGRLFRNFEVTPANDVARFFSKFSMQLIADDLTRFCVFFFRLLLLKCTEIYQFWVDIIWNLRSLRLRIWVDFFRNFQATYWWRFDKILRFFPSLALEMHRNLPIWGRLFRNFEFTPANDLGWFSSEFPYHSGQRYSAWLLKLFGSCSWNAHKSTNFASMFSKFWGHSGQRFGSIFLGRFCFEISRSLRPAIWVHLCGNFQFTAYVQYVCHN